MEPSSNGDGEKRKKANGIDLHAFNTLSKVAPSPGSTARKARNPKVQADDLLTQARKMAQFSMTLLGPSPAKQGSRQGAEAAAKLRGTIVSLDDEGLEEEIQDEVDQLITRIKSCTAAGSGAAALLDQALEEEELAAQMPGSTALVARLTQTLMNGRSEGGGRARGGPSSSGAGPACGKGGLASPVSSSNSPVASTGLRPSALSATHAALDMLSGSAAESPGLSPRTSHSGLSSAFMLHSAPLETPLLMPRTSMGGSGRQAPMNRSSGTMQVPNHTTAGRGSLGGTATAALDGAATASSVLQREGGSSSTHVPRLPAISSGSMGLSSSSGGCGAGAKRALPLPSADLIGGTEGGGFRQHSLTHRMASSSLGSACGNGVAPAAGQGYPSMPALRATSQSSSQSVLPAHSGSKSWEWDTQDPVVSTSDSIHVDGLSRGKPFSEMMAIVKNKHGETGSGSGFSTYGYERGHGATAVSRSDRLAAALAATHGGRRGGSLSGLAIPGLDRASGGAASTGGHDAMSSPRGGRPPSPAHLSDAAPQQLSTSVNGATGPVAGRAVLRPGASRLTRG